jgi:hypothetical protein
MADLADELAGRADPESGLDPELDDDEVFERSDKTILARRGKVRLDELVEASGFARNMWQDLEQVSPSTFELLEACRLILIDYVACTVHERRVCGAR